MSSNKRYAVYCSGRASRVTSFFKSNENVRKYSPALVVYDGDSKEVKELLECTFEGRVEWLDKSILSPNVKKRINNYTSDFIFERMLNFDCEYLICFGERILKANLINRFPDRLINFHPSLLPAFVGLNAIDRALEQHVGIIGNTAHYINSKVDDGEIILQSAMLSEDFNDYEDLLELQFPMLKLILRDVLGYNVDEIYSEINARKLPYIMPGHIIANF